MSKLDHMVKVRHILWWLFIIVGCVLISVYDIGPNGSVTI